MPNHEKDSKTGYIIPTRKNSVFFPDKKVEFLKCLEKTMEENSLKFDVAKAAKSVGISKKLVYEHMEIDPKFASDYLELKNEWLDNHEMNISEFGKKNFVASLAILKANRPDKWREKTTVQHQSSHDSMKEVLDRMKEKGWLIDVKTEKDPK